MPTKVSAGALGDCAEDTNAVKNNARKKISVCFMIFESYFEKNILPFTFKGQDI